MAFLNQDEDENQPNAPQAPQIPSVGPSSSPMSAPQAPQPKGSGRFTNIQKYINANQGAGSRLASGVGKKVESQINPELQKSQGQMESLRQGISAGQGSLQQGQQLKSQVQDANFDATGFAQDQGNVDKFTQFRTGAGLDEAALRNQAQTAQQQALAAQQKAQELGQQFGTEQGRQQLLKQTFSPGRNYSIGQQRLDNLFLQQASPEMKSIAGNIAGAQSQLGSLTSQLGTQAKTIEDLVAEEQGLTSGIQSGISAREQDLLNAVLGKQEQVNQERMASQQMARDQFGNLVGGKSINKDFAQLVDLQNNDRLMNVLRNDASIDKYLKFNDAMLTSADQLANQQERAKYDAIARLAGIDPNSRAINLDTQVANAVDSTGKLRSDINTARTAFDTAAPITNIVGTHYNQRNVDQTLQNLIPLADTIDSGVVESLRGNNFNLYNLENLFNNNQAVSNLTNQVTGDAYTGSAGTGWLTGAGIDRADRAARLNAIMQAYDQLANQGYLQRVNVEEPTLENTPTVTE